MTRYCVDLYRQRYHRVLDVLRRIVQEVASARDLDQALAIIVKRIKQAMAVDVCSVYLADYPEHRHVLMATDGLNPAAEGRVSLAMGEGVVSVVAAAQAEIQLLGERLSTHISAEEQALLDAYALMLSSESLVEKVIARIREG